MSEKLNVLFLCTGNSCRSQMAEGWTRHLKGDVIEAYSAGIETHGLNPSAVKVMAEAGVDISGHKSQHIEAFKDVNLDVAVTVCGNAHETCPFFPGNARVVHVGFDDPPKMAKELAEQGASEEEQLDCFRNVRDEIKAFVETLPASLNERSGIMTNLKIYDPAMCCSSGVCGPNVNEKLVELSSFLKELPKDEVNVERYNLSQQPKAYVDNVQVAQILKENGVDVLPLIFVGDTLVKSGEYPTKEELIKLLAPKSINQIAQAETEHDEGVKMNQENSVDSITEELIAIGASVGAHCLSCLEYHVKQAVNNGASKESIRKAVGIGHMVEKGAISAMKKSSSEIVEDILATAGTADKQEPEIDSGCCKNGGCC